MVNNAKENMLAEKYKKVALGTLPPAALFLVFFEKILLLLRKTELALKNNDKLTFLEKSAKASSNFCQFMDIVWDLYYGLNKEVRVNLREVMSIFIDTQQLILDVVAKPDFENIEKAINAVDELRTLWVGEMENLKKGEVPL